MRIVINHLTRMKRGYMCVAGINPDTGLHVRPVMERQLTIDLLSIHGGPFDIGRIIDLGETRFVGKVPEVEDLHFEANQVCHVSDMPDSQYWELLESVAQEKLRSIFGPDLQRIGATCAISEMSGLRSLGCYWVQGGRVYLEQKANGCRIKFHWESDGQSFTVPVTDIRLYLGDHVTPCEKTVAWLQERLRTQPRVLVSIGVSRPFRKSAGDPPRHWLQINNFHLPDLPGWRLLDGFRVAESS